MATPIIMPRQGQSVESCIIATWRKKKGDAVNVGEILFTYETDKAAFDEEAKVAGVLLEIFFEEGDDVPCLTNVCVIGQVGESTAEYDPRGAAPQASQATAEKVETVTSDAVPVATAAIPQALSGEIRVSPRARHQAEQTGVDVRFVEGTGPKGRIIERDVLAAEANGVRVTPAAQAVAGGLDHPVDGSGLGGRITTADLAAPVSAAAPAEKPMVAPISAVEIEEVPLSNIRKVIARTMQQSLSSMAQLTLNSAFDATELLEQRKKYKAAMETLGLENITLNDMILYAISRVLPKHRDLNAHLLEDRIRYFGAVNLGVAVDTERGLMVPTLFNAEQKSLSQISREVKALAKQCQQGTISPDLLKGGTFTITNLGTLDVESFTPVINPPQTGILGVCGITTRVREGKNGLTTYSAMGLSLTFDHRAVDGAPAARFLKDLKVALENFGALLTL